MSAVSDKIIINFAWTGPNAWEGGRSHGGLDVGVVDLIFKNAKTEISVHLPQNINPVAAQKFPFTCRRYHDTEWTIRDRKFKPLAKQTHPELLKVTVEQIHNLTIRAGIFEQGRPIGPRVMDPSTGKITQQETVRRSNRDVRLEIPEELEIGQTYSLIVASDDLSLSARLIKEEKASSVVVQAERKANRGEFLERTRKMGEALIAEGLQNLKLASRGGAGVFDSSSTTADVHAHGMQGIIRAGQEMHSDIEVPDSKPPESPSELDKLSIEALQSRFEETFVQDKQFEAQRMKAAIAGNIEEMNRVIQAEHENSQLLINLGEALERKGISPQIPQTDSYQSAARASSTLHTDAIKNLNDSCKTQ